MKLFWKRTDLAVRGSNLTVCRVCVSRHLRRPNLDFLEYRVAQKKRGHHLIANILKFHDRIAWKLVNFCNIIC